jgi:hypothetical protein
VRPLSCARLSIGNVLEFLCWKWKPYPRVVFRKSRLGVSNETVKYGLSSAGLGPQSDCSGKVPEAIVWVSSERAPHVNKPAIVKQKTKTWSWAPDGSPAPRQTGRLTFYPKLTSTSISPCPNGGGLEYLHHSHASRKRRRKGNPVSWSARGQEVCK